MDLGTVFSTVHIRRAFCHRSTMYVYLIQKLPTKAVNKSYFNKMSTKAISTMSTKCQQKLFDPKAGNRSCVTLTPRAVTHVHLKATRVMTGSARLAVTYHACIFATNIQQTDGSTENVRRASGNAAPV
jgi:hypothetical protein